MTRVQGVAVASRRSFEAVNRAIEAHGLKLVVDQTFTLALTAAAFTLMKRGGHYSKIAITLE